jgi:outer membrane protein, heavy metal efflux system
MKYCFFILLLVVPLVGFSQKAITLDEAEQLMQKNNLMLLAEQYNISGAKAAVIQAKIWEQPYLQTEINLINPQDNKMLDIGVNGEKMASIQQLIYLGGKKRNEIDFAKTNVEIAELQFEQLIRNLKFQLAQTFYNIYYDSQKASILDIQIDNLETLLKNYAIQEDKGNLPLKDVVRLQSLVLNLKNEKLEITKNIIESQQTISLLTGEREEIQPKVNESELINQYQHQNVIKDSLISVALENNLDYLTSLKLAESQELFLKWQKSLAVPDMNVGLAYDQRGGAFQNQVDFTLGIPLPLWNKNRGNIQLAEARSRQAGINKEYERLDLESKVTMLWKLWIEQKNQLSNVTETVNENLATVYSGMLLNFQRNNISILEFTDFMESYNQTTIHISELKKAWIMASIRLNYITNKDIFKL